MIDIQILRTDPERLAQVIQQKRISVDVKKLQDLDIKKRSLQGQLDELSRQRNDLAGLVTSSQPTPEQIKQGRLLKEEASKIEAELKAVQTEFEVLWKEVPNFPTSDTPIGEDETANQILRKWGDIPSFDFKPKPHWEIGDQLDLINQESAAEMAGSRFTFLKQELVWLQFALVQFGLRTLTDSNILDHIIKENNLGVANTPFIPIIPPVFTRPEVMDKMARLEPREERYYIPSDNLYLIGSAEHALGILHMNETLSLDSLPRRYVGYSTSFRREAGSHGKDVRGILRLHQFDKLEMESFTSAENSLVEQDLFVAIQEYLMKKLGLPYQVVICSTGDMGGPDARHIDIETWLPGQNAYRETHSADLMTDYQARRLGTRVKRENSETQYAHMNDATVFAIGRTLVAIMENYQQADGSVTVPEVLRPYVPFESIRRA